MKWLYERGFSQGSTIVAVFDGAPPERLRHAAGVRQIRTEGRMLSMLVNAHVSEVVEQARNEQAREIEVTPVTLKLTGKSNCRKLVGTLVKPAFW